MLSKDSKILLLHPFMNYFGGAEYMLNVVANELFPNADIYTLAYNDDVLKEALIHKDRLTSPAKNLFHFIFRQGTPLYPAIVDSLQVDPSYDLVLSLSYAYVHGVVTSHHQPHVSYIHSPMRLLWMNESDYYGYNKVPAVREVYRTILASQRTWDVQASSRPDYLVTASKEVQKRVKSFWGRDSAVIYPPVDVDFYSQGAHTVKKEDYYITHSRLVRFKRVDILVELFKSRSEKLMIVGDGPEYATLKALAGGSPNIIFTGHVSDPVQRRELLQKAKGYVYASFEDFGISPVEALAAGLPVMAYKKGGTAETVTTSVGVFVPAQTSLSFQEHFPQFVTFCESFSPGKAIEHAQKFNKNVFKQQFVSFIDQKMEQFAKEGPPVITVPSV